MTETPRIALVTGGAQGLGLAAARALAVSGRKVAIANSRPREEIAKLAKSEGFHYAAWDVADHEVSEAALAEIERDFGPVEILVNNAGIARDRMFHKMEKADWDAVLRTDLDSLFNVTRPVIGGMRERGFGRIVNIASINGQKGQMGQTNYAAAKAGMIGFTKALALESAGRGVTVNAIAPGYCDTEMMEDVRDEALKAILAATPVGRLGSPADIGRCVAFLTSDEADFITGATLSVNGGLYMV